MVAPRQLAVEDVSAPLVLTAGITKGKVFPQLPISEIVSKYPLLIDPGFGGPVAIHSAPV